MSGQKRAILLKLTATAYEVGLDALHGELRQDEQGNWLVGKKSLEAWLMAHRGQEVALVLGSFADDHPVEVKTCRTCGRDYIEMECPTCRANRIRLRGRA